MWILLNKLIKFILRIVLIIIILLNLLGGVMVMRELWKVMFLICIFFKVLKFFVMVLGKLEFIIKELFKMCIFVFLVMCCDM